MSAGDWRSEPGVPTAKFGFILGSKTSGPQSCRNEYKLAVVPRLLL